MHLSQCVKGSNPDLVANKKGRAGGGAQRMQEGALCVYNLQPLQQFLLPCILSLLLFNLKVYTLDLL